MHTSEAQGLSIQAPGFLCFKLVDGERTVHGGPNRGFQRAWMHRYSPRWLTPHWPEDSHTHASNRKGSWEIPENFLKTTGETTVKLTMVIILECKEMLNHDVVYQESTTSQLYFKNKLREKEIRSVVIPAGVYGRGNWMKAVKRLKLPVIRWINSRDIMYNLVNMINTVTCYILKLLRQ